MSEEAETKPAPEPQTPADNPPTLAEQIVAIIQDTITEGYLMSARDGLNIAQLTNGTMSMMYFGLVLAQRHPAEAAQVIVALRNINSATWPTEEMTAEAVDEIIKQARGLVGGS